jgi:hypothetical protein
MKYRTIDGTPIVFTDKIKPGEFQYCSTCLVVGQGTDLLELAQTLADFDSKFLKECRISPLDTVVL